MGSMSIKTMDEPAIGASVAYLGQEIHDAFEPRLPSVDRRLEALGKLQEEGIETCLLICPYLPCLTDLEGIIKKASSVVDKIWVYPLSLRDERKKRRMERIVGRQFPHIADHFVRVSSQPHGPYWEEVRGRVDEMGREALVEIINCI